MDEEMDYEAHKRPKLNMQGILDDQLSSTSSTSNRSGKYDSLKKQLKQQYYLKAKQGLKLVFIAYNHKSNWQNLIQKDGLNAEEAYTKHAKSGISLTSLAMTLSQ